MAPGAIAAGGHINISKQYASNTIANSDFAEEYPELVVNRKPEYAVSYDTRGRMPPQRALPIMCIG